jgi:hypothetical protein
LEDIVTKFSNILVASAVTLFGFAASPAFAHSHLKGETVDAVEGQIVFEVIGQVDNSAMPAPLGSSTQFGYISFARGIDPIFTDSNPANQNESTAELTFFTQVNTTRVTANGPFRVIIREGTTTLYLNTPPSSFSNPDSFASGTPIQVSNIRQQVIVDTVENTFTVTNLNTITSATPFPLNGGEKKLGRVNDEFRTSLQGVVTVRNGGTPPPTGFFSGYAVGIDPNGD